MENAYWSGKGKFQKEYDALEQKLLRNENGPDCAEGKLLNNLAGFYYRRYNDGDMTSSYASPFNKGAKAMEKFGLPHLVLNRYVDEIRLESIVDTVVEFLYNRLFKKQVTVVIQVAIVMEVPVNLTNPEIDELVKNDTNWDVECDKKIVNVVEVSDILAVNSITEAHLD